MTSNTTSTYQPRPLGRLAGADVYSCQAGVMSGTNSKGMQSRWGIQHPFTLEEAGR